MVRCWGRNSVGQLGYGDTVSRAGSSVAVDVDVGTGRTALAVVCGYGHTCAWLDNGSTVCWGLNWSGQLGYGRTAETMRARWAMQ